MAENRINSLFGEAVYTKFVTERYGIKNCKNTLDIDLLNDVNELLVFITEAEGCENEIECCSVTKVEEYINTL